MREPVEERGCHLGIAKDAGPFTKCEGRCDDYRSALIEITDEMEQELAAGLGERQIAEFVQDQEVEAGDQICRATLQSATGSQASRWYAQTANAMILRG